MNEFFRVWDIARRQYSLERLVHIDSDGAYIRIYLNGSIIVRADGSAEDDADVNFVYLMAAKRLLAWMERKEKSHVFDTAEKDSS
jgi:hypothetical protein